jgi:hypothetical protein
VGEILLVEKTDGWVSPEKLIIVDLLEGPRKNSGKPL